MGFRVEGPGFRIKTNFGVLGFRVRALLEIMDGSLKLSFMIASSIRIRGVQGPRAST